MTDQTSSEQPNKASSPLDEFFKKHVWALPAGIGVLAILAVLLVLYLSGVFGGGDEGPSESPSPTTTTSAPASDNGGNGGQSGVTTAPTAAPVDNQPEQSPSAAPDVSSQQVQAVADSYVAQVNNTSDSASLASGVDGIAAQPLVESLKVATYDILPKGGKLSGSPSSDEDGLWTADVVDAEGKSLYQLTLVNQGTDIRVVYMDVREVVTDDEPRLDAQGYPLPQPVYPLSKDQADGIKSTAWGVVKTYGEYDGGESLEAREGRVSGAVHGGPYPALKTYTTGGGERIRLYQPEKFEMLMGVPGDGSKPDTISVNITVAYGNGSALEPVPIETMNLIVDFKWDSNLEMWQAVELRTA